MVRPNGVVMLLYLNGCGKPEGAKENGYAIFYSSNYHRMKKLIYLLAFMPIYCYAQSNQQAYNISKYFVKEYVKDTYNYLQNPSVTNTTNCYTIFSSFYVKDLGYKYNYESTLAFIGGNPNEKKSWKLLSFYLEGKEFYFDNNYKKYVKK